MFTDIIKQFESITDSVKQSELQEVPFRHLFIREVISYDAYRSITELNAHNDLEMSDLHGRKEYRIIDNNDAWIWEEESNKLFQELCKKFRLGKVTDEQVGCTATFWEDSEQFTITDIHTDAFYDTDLTISCQIYLPNDESQINLGTKLYRYVGDNIEEDANQDEGTKYPHQARHDKLDKFEHSRSVPFQPNSMFCTVNSKDGWHQAPVITQGVRKSLMLRFKV